MRPRKHPNFRIQSLTTSTENRAYNVLIAEQYTNSAKSNVAIQEANRVSNDLYVLICLFIIVPRLIGNHSLIFLKKSESLNLLYVSKEATEYN